MANPIFPTFPLRTLPKGPSALMEAELQDGVLILRGALHEKGVQQLKALLARSNLQPKSRVELSELREVDGAGFAFLVALGKGGATLVSPRPHLRRLLEKSRLFEVLEVEYE